MDQSVILQNSTPIMMGESRNGRSITDDMDRESLADSSHPKRRHRKLNSDIVVKVAMSLYKVQQNIYLLDF